VYTKNAVWEKSALTIFAQISRIFLFRQVPPFYFEWFCFHVPITFWALHLSQFFTSLKPICFGGFALNFEISRGERFSGQSPCLPQAKSLDDRAFLESIHID
jgi:hypothetical protein